MNRVLVFGGRDYANQEWLFRVLDAADDFLEFGLVIHGAAPGADTLAEEWAKARGVDVLAFPAAWDDIGRPGAVVRHTRAGKPYDAAAGGVRNQKMIDVGRPTVAIGFPGGTGTRDMTRRVIGASIPLFEIVERCRRHDVSA